MPTNLYLIVRLQVISWSQRPESLVNTLPFNFFIVISPLPTLVWFQRNIQLFLHNLIDLGYFGGSFLIADLILWNQFVHQDWRTWRLKMVTDPHRKVTAWRNQKPSWILRIPWISWTLQRHLYCPHSYWMSWCTPVNSSILTFLYWRPANVLLYRWWGLNVIISLTSMLTTLLEWQRYKNLYQIGSPPWRLWYGITHHLHYSFLDETLGHLALHGIATEYCKTLLMTLFSEETDPQSEVSHDIHHDLELFYYVLVALMAWYE